MSKNASEIIPNLVIGHKQDGRARYSKQGKRTLVEACLKPGVSVFRMALVNGLNANLLRKWITQYQDLVDTPIIAVATTQAAAVTLVPVKVLWWSGDGMCLFIKRLERGRFIWPQADSGAVHLSAAQLSMLLEGIDWRRPERTWRAPPMQ